MAIGKISGPMLQTNLARQGVDLSVDTNLVYFDVTNRRLGVGNNSPIQALDVPGNVRLANLSILGNTITSNTGKINLGSTANITITGGTANYVMSTDGAGNLSWAQISDLDYSFGNLAFNDTTVQVTKLNANLYLSANGTGSINANGAVITNVALPVASSDVVNLSYLNSTLANFNDDRLISGNTTLLVTAGNVSIASGSTLVNQFTPTYSTINNVKITSTTISSLTGDLRLAGLTTNNKIIMDNTSSVTVPRGDTASRPASAVSGDLRYNTDINSLEYYTGSAWYGTTVSIASQVLNGDGTTTTFTLSNTTTTTGVLISINGTLQQPTSAYSVSGGTVLTFVEAPAAGDVIEIRYISLTVSPSFNSMEVSTGNVVVGTSPTVIDYFPSATYRSVKYNIQASGTSTFSLDDVSLIHNGAVATITVTSAATGSNVGVYTANLASGNVQLLFTAVNSNTILRIHKAQFLI